MPRLPTLRRAGLVLAALILAGCGATPAPTTAPAVSPSRTASAPTGSPSVLPSDARPPGRVPPDAALLAAGAGDPIVGQLGSYVWGESGSDSPWLPGTPVTVEPGRSLRFGLSFQVPVASWSARYATPGEPSPGRPAGLDNGSAPLEVKPPPAGDWTLALTVQFGVGLGSATWYWRVRVP